MNEPEKLSQETQLREEQLLLPKHVTLYVLTWDFIIQVYLSNFSKRIGAHVTYYQIFTFAFIILFSYFLCIMIPT